MTYIILTRNPRTKALVAIVEEHPADMNTLTELTTEGEANKVAQLIPICRAWGYQVVEVEGP